MPIALDFFDFDGFDGLIPDSENCLSISLAILALLLLVAAVGEFACRIRRRSPVEKLLRRRFG